MQPVVQLSVMHDDAHATTSTQSRLSKQLASVEQHFVLTQAPQVGESKAVFESSAHLAERLASDPASELVELPAPDVPSVASVDVPHLPATLQGVLEFVHP